MAAAGASGGAHGSADTRPLRAGEGSAAEPADAGAVAGGGPRGEPRRPDGHRGGSDGARPAGVPQLGRPLGGGHLHGGPHAPQNHLGGRAEKVRARRARAAGRVKVSESLQTIGDGTEGLVMFSLAVGRLHLA